MQGRHFPNSVAAFFCAAADPSTRHAHLATRVGLCLLAWVLTPSLSASDRAFLDAKEEHGSASQQAQTATSSHIDQATLDADVEEDEDWFVLDDGETLVVTAKAPTLPEPGVHIDIDAGAYAIDLAAAVDSAPGARVLRSGNALAPSELRVRGLGGPRLSVRLDGIPLDDPSGMAVDLTELSGAPIDQATLLRGPEAGALAPGAIAGVLALRSREVPQGLHARLLSSFTSQQGQTHWSGLSYRDDVIASEAAVFVGQSPGDFVYRPLSYSGDSPIIGPTTTRLNNEQQRYGATVRARTQATSWNAWGLLHAAHHEGGIAGLSGHPTPRAYQQDDSVLMAGHAESYFDFGRLGLDASGLLRNQSYANPDLLLPTFLSQRTQSARLAAMWTHALSARFDTALGVELTHAQSEPLGVVEPPLLAPDNNAQRWAAATQGRLRMQFFQQRVAVDSGLRLDALSDVGIEPSWSTRVSAALNTLVVVEAYAGRAFRPPTFVERYGPIVGYMHANPDLLAEDGIEGGVSLQLKRTTLSAELNLFAARLGQAILYLNRNAYEVRPENAGVVWRGGGEACVHVRPFRWLRHSASVELLLSQVALTQAPLPTSPLLVLASRSEVMFERVIANLGANVYVDARAQSQASSNLYGELTVPAQANLDAGVALTWGQYWALSVQMSNLFDVQTRVDLHQVPLPGRQVMLTLRMGV